MGLKSNCNDHLRLIVNRVVNFLLALIEPPTGAGYPKFQVEGVAPPTLLFLRKLR